MFLLDRAHTFRSAVGFSDSDVVFGSDTPRWRFMKKQMIISLRQCGDGLKQLEAMTLKHGEEMLQEMEKFNGKAFNPFDLILMTASTITLTLMYGCTTKQDTRDIIDVSKQILDVFCHSGPYMMLDVFPFLRYIVPSVKKAYQNFMFVVNKANTHYANKTAARKEIYHHPEVDFFIDHFLKLQEMSKINEDKSKTVEERDIISMGIDIFNAGVSTTSRTLQMMLAVLVNHQEIQDRAYNEIFRVIGKQKPRLKDRMSLPYVEALILETMRYHSVAMFGAPHVARCDTNLDGYFIPKGSFVFANLWGMHHDERYWDQPWEFRPSRFIEEGVVVSPNHKNKQRLLPFGAGRRQCAGEVYARNRLFLLTCLLLQKFKFIPAEGHSLPCHDPRDSCKADILLKMKPYKLSVHLRP